MSGPTPFVRCLAADAGATRELRVGRARLRFEGRSLRIDGLTQPARVAAFSGPAFHAPPGQSQLDALRAAAPDLLLVLGDLGDDETRARATLAGLSTLSVPVLVLAGGRDTLARTSDAIQALSAAEARVVDISPLTEVRLAGHIWVPLAGAYEGRYASSDQGCGYSLADLAARVAAIRDGAPRLTQLVAWERPEAWPAPGSETEQPLAGEAVRSNADIVEIATRAGGIFAWPHTHKDPLGAALAPGQALVAPRLTGPYAALEDGSRVAPGFALFTLDGTGLRPVKP